MVMAVHSGDGFSMAKSRKVIDLKHGNCQGWCGWCSDVNRLSHGVSLWKHIQHGWTTFKIYLIQGRVWHNGLFLA